MGGINRVIINEISNGDIHTFLFDSSSQDQMYGIDVPDAQDIKVYSEKGAIRFSQEIIGSRTLIRFDNRTGYYAIAYTKPRFIKDNAGIYTYAESWDAPGRALIVFALPSYSVISSSKSQWTLSKNKQNQLIIDWIGTGTLNVDLQYQISSEKFAKQSLREIEEVQLQLNLFPKPKLIQKTLATSADLLDWLQRFQALYQFIAPILRQVHHKP